MVVLKVLGCGIIKRIHYAPAVGEGAGVREPHKPCEGPAVEPICVWNWGGCEPRIPSNRAEGGGATARWSSNAAVRRQVCDEEAACHPAALPRGRRGAGPPTGAAAAEAIGRQVRLWPQGRTVVWCRATAR